MNRGSNNKQQLNEAVNPFAAIIKFLSSLLGAFVGTALSFTRVFGKENGQAIAQNVENVEKTSIKAIQRSKTENKEEAIQQIKVIKRNYEQKIIAIPNQNNPKEEIKRATQVFQQEIKQVLDRAEVPVEDARVVLQSTSKVTESVTTSEPVSEEESKKELLELIKNNIESEEAKLAMIECLFGSFSRDNDIRQKNLEKIKSIKESKIPSIINKFNLALASIKENNVFKRDKTKEIFDIQDEEKIIDIFIKAKVTNDKKNFASYYDTVNSIFNQDETKTQEPILVPKKEKPETQKTNDNSYENMSIKDLVNSNIREEFTQYLNLSDEDLYKKMREIGVLFLQPFKIGSLRFIPVGKKQVQDGRFKGQYEAGCLIFQHKQVVPPVTTLFERIYKQSVSDKEKNTKWAKVIRLPVFKNSIVETEQGTIDLEDWNTDKGDVELVENPKTTVTTTPQADTLKNQSLKELNKGNKFMDINKLRLLIIEQRAEMAINPSQPPMDMTGEPDYEGGMARNELKTAARDAMALVEKLKESDQLPAWCQSKITMASEYIQTVKEYLESEMDDGSQEEQY